MSSVLAHFTDKQTKAATGSVPRASDNTSVGMGVGVMPRGQLPLYMSCSGAWTPIQGLGRA